MLAPLTPPWQNCPLAALAAADYERRLPHLEQVLLELDRARYESGSQQEPEYLYSPTASIVSLLYVMENVSSAEITALGNEGMTEAAGKPQAQGLIHDSRSRITVPDRPKLEARVRECYAVVKQESDRLFSRKTVIVGQVS